MAGRKQTHWMWFVFAQIAGLGPSAMAQTYAIESLEEALAYLAYPLLEPRLHSYEMHVSVDSLMSLCRSILAPSPSLVLNFAKDDAKKNQMACKPGSVLLAKG